MQKKQSSLSRILSYAGGHKNLTLLGLSLIHISEPTRQTEISYAVFCLKKKKQLIAKTTFCMKKQKKKK